MKAVRHLKRMKLNDRGSAIVTVIVVTIFISILATTMLFVSGRGYIMKQTDYQNKQSFYMAEQTLDTLKEMLVLEVDEAYEYAYRDMMNNYLWLGNDNKRQTYYMASFTKYLDDKWKKDLTDPNMKLAIVKKFMEDTYKIMNPDGGETEIKDMIKLVTDVKNFGIVEDSTKGSMFVIEGVQVYFVDEKGFSSYINTDIALIPPDYNASGVTGTEPEKVNMSECVIYRNWKKN